MNETKTKPDTSWIPKNWTFDDASVAGRFEALVRDAQKSYESQVCAEAKIRCLVGYMEYLLPQAKLFDQMSEIPGVINEANEWLSAREALKPTAL
jgi:hypothetical protein